MKIDPHEGVLPNDDSTAAPSEDVTAGVEDQPTDTTLSEAEGDEGDSGAPTADAQDDLIDESDAPPGAEEWVRKTNKAVQRRLREASEAQKELQRAREELAVTRAQQQGLAAALKSKDPARMLEFLKEQFGGDAGEEHDASAPVQFQFKPRKPMSNAEAQEALNEQFSDLGAQLLDSVRSLVSQAQRPLSEKVAKSEVLVRDQAWSKVVAEYGQGASQWREKAEQLVARGMPMTEALMAASQGKAYELKLQRAAAAKKAKGAATPTLPPRGRAPQGATPSVTGRRLLSAYLTQSKRM